VGGWNGGVQGKKTLRGAEFPVYFFLFDVFCFFFFFFFFFICPTEAWKGVRLRKPGGGQRRRVRQAVACCWLKGVEGGCRSRRMAGPVKAGVGACRERTQVICDLYKGVGP